MEMEEWKDVVGYECIYEVSDLGQVRNKKSGKILKHDDNGTGYLMLGLNHYGRKMFLVHRLVAIAHIPNPNNLPEVNHKDGKKYNCFKSNLEWCTHKENIDHCDRVLGFNRRMINKDKIGALNWNSKSVDQFDMEDNFIASYGSTTEAYRATGVDFSSIQKVCLGQRVMAGGFKWKYKPTPQ
jgi:hypothetical protein